MGIKGRRKKLREREAKMLTCMQENSVVGAKWGISNCRNGEDAFSMEVGTILESKGEGVGMLNNSDEFIASAQRRPKWKNSELYRFQDEDYLGRIHEEHERRHTSHLPPTAQTRRRPRGKECENGVFEKGADAESIARLYLGQRFKTEDVVGGRAAPREVDHGYRHTSNGDCVSMGTHNEELAASLGLEHDQTSRQRSGKVGQGGAAFDHPLIALEPELVRALRAEGFRFMTLIQERAIPLIMEGYDLFGQACTGSGKTLAFCIPILHATKALLRKHPRSTAALMLSPTKELCVQTHDVLKSLCQHITEVNFVVQLVTGGTKLTDERRHLSAGASLVVGTPGRVRDHAQHCVGWDLCRLRFLVLDEADRMLADGFQRDLDAILPRLPKSRQTLLFSATNSKSIQELARLSLSRTPLFVDTSLPAPLSILSFNASGDSADSLAACNTSNEGLHTVAMPFYRQFRDTYATMPSHGTSCDADERADRDSNTLTTSHQGAGTAREEGSSDNREGGMERDANFQNDAPSCERAAIEEDVIPSTLRQFCHIAPLEDRLRSLYIFIKRVVRNSKAMVFCSSVASTTFHFQMMGSVGFHDDVLMLHGHMKHRQRLDVFRVFQSWETGVLFCTDVAARGLDIPDVEWILQYDPPMDPTEYIHRIGRTARAGSVGNALLFLIPEEAYFIKYLNRFGMRLERYPMPAQLPAIQEKLEHVLQLDEVVAKSAISAFRAHIGAYQSHILKDTFNVHRLDLKRLAAAFGLSCAPHVTLPRDAAEQKKQEYVKGKLKSLNRRRWDALRHYEQLKTKRQWENGAFVGITKPS